MRLTSAILAGVLAVAGLSPIGRYTTEAVAPISTTPDPVGLHLHIDHRRPLVLRIDRRGPGRLVEAFGDLRTAEDIAVLVPGANTTLRSVLDQSQGASTQLTRAARSIRAQAARLDPRVRMAAVAWLGYHPPSIASLSTLTSTSAVAASRSLDRFLANLPATAHVTLLCHSYGSVVCAYAAHRAKAVNIVAIGSPGMDVRRAADIGGTARIWSMRTSNDPILLTPFVRFGDLGHGTDPTDPAFGATRLATGSARGHSDYYKPGTTALVNLAKVVIGDTDTGRGGVEVLK